MTTPSATPGRRRRQGGDPAGPEARAASPPRTRLAGLPKTPVTDEKFGQRMFLPSPYGQAFVTSQTLDVYQQTLLQSNTVYGFVAHPERPDPARPEHRLVPDEQPVPAPRCSRRRGRLRLQARHPAQRRADLHHLHRRDGAARATATSSQGEIGHDASYMRVVEAYTLKRQIDQQAFQPRSYARTTRAEQPVVSALDELIGPVARTPDARTPLTLARPRLLQRVHLVRPRRDAGGASTPTRPATTRC